MRHAKSRKQVRALIPLQPSTVVDYESCEIGDQQVCADLGEETSRAMEAGPRVDPVISGLPAHAVNEEQA